MAKIVRHHQGSPSIRDPLTPTRVQVENAAMMGCNQPVDDDPTSLEPGNRTDSVERHQPAVACNVGREDPCEVSFTS
jgi:hypothetical protein